MAAILDLREIPCGALATAYKPYPSSSGRANEDPDDGYFPVCKHGGWSECGLQAEALCAGNLTNTTTQARLIDCHFQHGAAGGAGVMSSTIGADCAAEVGLDYDAVFACAFEGQYPVPYGLGLLHAAFSEQNERDVQGTPSVFIDGEATDAAFNSATLVSRVAVFLSLCVCVRRALIDRLAIVSPREATRDL